jgi:hypothetical protein
LLNGGAPTTSTYNAANELVTSQASSGVTTTTYLCSWQPQSSTFFARSAWRVARPDRLGWRIAA